MNKSEQILHNALENLQQSTGVKYKLQVRKPGDKMSGDGIVELSIGKDKKKFMVMVEGVFRTVHMAKVLGQWGDQPVLFIAPSISEEAKEELKRKAASYLEESGNCHIRINGSIIHVQGKKKIPSKVSPSRAFKKTGLKVIFQYLINPGFINASYREIADHAEVSLGNITYINNSLKKDGFIIELSEDKNQLINVEELFERWVDGYIRVLRPSLLRFRADFFDEVLKEENRGWKSIPLDKELSCWGGEPAANIITDYIMPQSWTLYSSEKRMDLVSKYYIFPAENGRIEVYDKFWSHKTFPSRLAHPITVYADLLATNNARCIEVANMIKEQYINEHLQRISNTGDKKGN